MQVRGLIAIPLAVTAALAAGCDPLGGDAASEAAPGTVRIGITEPRHLVPSNTNDTDGSEVLAALFTPLVGYDGDHRAQPLAAESIKSTDRKVWTITLKDGYTFHNGEPVTADSYVDAWNYAAYAPNNQANSYFFARVAGYADTQPVDPDGGGPEPAAEPKSRTLSGLKKVDDRTFRVTLSTPFTELPAMLGDTAFYPLPRAAWQSPGVLNPEFEDTVIGQGPFKLKGTWRRGAAIDLERYEAYPGDKPKVPAVRFQPYDQLTAAYGDLLVGDLDVLRTVPAEKVTSAPEDLGDRYGRQVDSTLQFLAFPTYQQEFSDPDVRTAISMAIDRNAVFPDGRPARAFVPPVVAGYREDSCGAACQFDAAAAKRLYTEAGGPAKLQITYNEDGGHGSWVEATCAQLRTNLGVECAGAAVPRFVDLLDKVAARQPVGLFRMGWPMDYPSMESYLAPLYSTTGSSNYSGYSNTRFDSLVSEATQAATEADMIKKYQQAEDVLAQDMPVVPLRFGQTNYGWSARVREVQLDEFGRLNLVALESTG
ncbi:peptide ABC transporter substrate-binding protein [Micromonospora sp. CPCC 206061]|uniref:peptide ABC transporter substrate-binding protein n=1 Tax=Micromonospora sp. CPCC 206061 TaxID=3122410 RepID=UPI002FEEE777